jgi:hypothetical protein
VFSPQFATTCVFSCPKVYPKHPAPPVPPPRPKHTAGGIVTQANAPNRLGGAILFVFNAKEITPMHDPDPPRSHVMPVIENHAAYAVRYCEMCGGEVDRSGECCDQRHDVPTNAEMARVVRILCNWSMERPEALRVLANKIAIPGDSIRDICKSYPKVSRYQVHKFLHELGEYWPAAKAILGLESATARTQRQRREREKQCKAKR